VATPFDPLGLISPAILKVRAFLHSIWDKDLGWDDELPPDKKLEWLELVETWHDVTFEWSRFIGFSLQDPGVSSTSSRMHAMSDSASQFTSGKMATLSSSSGRVY
jgi:hypothetical protein